MSEREILIRAFKAEARMKPDERIKLGWNLYTYREFADMLGSGEDLSKEEKNTLKSFVDNALKMFRENPAYKQKMMSLAGVA